MPRPRLALVLALLTPTWAAAEAPDLLSAPSYYVQPVGTVAAEHARYACRVIAEAFEVRCKVQRTLPLPRRAFNARRNQYDADRLVKELFDELPADAVGLMALTNADLFDAGRTRFVFGLASLVDHVGVVSMARYRGQWWGHDEDRGRFYERLYKVLVHEAGHTLGLGHCPNRHCAMRDDTTLADLDASPRHFCERCRAAAEEGRASGPGTVRFHYTRAHGHLLRAQFARAVYHFERAVELDEGDPRLLNDLGVAYLRRGDRARALWSFRHAQRMDPGFAYAWYNEGLVFLSAADARSARTAFEQALEADPNWPLAHRQLGYLYAEAFTDPEAALRHFEAYLDTHGDDALVEERVRMIKGGGEQ